MALPFVTSAQFRMIFPLFLLGIIFFGMDNIILVTQANWGLAANLPYFFLITAFLLCSVFKQGRIAMISMAMLMAYSVIQNRLQIPLSSGFRADRIISACLSITECMFYCLSV